MVLCTVHVLWGLIRACSYEEDIELAKKLNVNAFRLSIEWHRIEVQPRVYDMDAIRRCALERMLRYVLRCEDCGQRICKAMHLPCELPARNQHTHPQCEHQARQL